MVSWCGVGGVVRGRGGWVGGMISAGGMSSAGGMISAGKVISRRIGFSVIRSRSDAQRTRG